LKQVTPIYKFRKLEKTAALNVATERLKIKGRGNQFQSDIIRRKSDSCLTRRDNEKREMHVNLLHNIQLVKGGQLLVEVEEILSSLSLIFAQGVFISQRPLPVTDP
jgi:hypothetical protein